MPRNNLNLRQFLLTGYAVPHTLGYIPLADGRVNDHPMSALELLERAERLGLGGIEVPLAAKVPSFEGRVVELPAVDETIVARLAAGGHTLVADFGIVVDHSFEEISDYIRLSHRLGARVVRAVISNLLCGDRRPVPGGWNERLSGTAERLRQVLPAAEQLGMTIAIENHQDASTDDLLRLMDAAGPSPALGVTFDTGNPLAMGEDPVSACKRLVHVIRHVHLKDYVMVYIPTGYQLVRCAAGQGVVDFRAILEIVRGAGREMTLGVEIAAHSARSIPLLDPLWWTTYPPRDATSLLPVLELLWRHGRPGTQDDRGVWERGGDTEAVRADEWRLVEESVDYLADLTQS